MNKQLLFLLVLGSTLAIAMDGDSKFTHILPDSRVNLELNVALYRMPCSVINKYAGLTINPSRIQTIKKNAHSQLKTYCDSFKNVCTFFAVDETYTAQLLTGETIECRYIQMKPDSGEIQARAIVGELQYPLPISNNNFFVLRKFHATL
ncbi:hypothetical protein BH09DEP1_BH09DEP1_7760 [soil metagenome]